MTTPTEPTFSYPASNAREFWVKCSKDDPDALEHWCGVVDAWFTLEGHSPSSHLSDSNSDKCGTIWRKKVQVPDGWEIVPLDEKLVEGYKYLAGESGSWCPGVAYSGITVREKHGYGLRTFYYIRPIAEAIPGAMMAPAPPAPHESDLILEMLITGGFVSKEKVEQARAFVRKL